jgi:3-methylcrotonyl-CoA carboxylase alpha subunit
MDGDGNPYFLEVNTRLQVEHPVTEMVTGIDLVAWQLLVAQGDPLPAAQEDIKQEGHAIEVRIYAEDPLNGFLPSIGKITRWEPGYSDQPSDNVEFRLDSGVDIGSQVTIYYDPQLAKLIVHSSNRDQAMSYLAGALVDFEIQRVTTNLSFLLWLVVHPEFRAGNTDTGFIDRHWHPNARGEPLPDNIALMLAADEITSRDTLNPVSNPWHLMPSPLTQQDVTLVYDYIPPGFPVDPKKAHEVRVVARRTSEDPDTWNMQAGSFAGPVHLQWRDWELMMGLETPNGIEWKRVNFYQSRNYNGRLLIVQKDGKIYRLLRPAPLSTDTLAVAVHLPGENHLQAPMPGKIILVPVQEGQEVAEGERLVVMEAMKMEFTLRAPHAGRVTRLPVREGQLVDAGTVLVEIEQRTEAAQ